MPAGRPQLRIRLLGGLDVEVDGDPRELPSLSAARSLLGLLALEGRPLPRGELAARFWPDVLDESARTSLRTALSALRRCLGDAGLVADREAVALEGAWTDVAEFERLLAEGRREAALELYRGPLLAGLDDDWVYERRDEFRDRAGQSLSELAGGAERAGDARAAIEHTRRWAALDPLDEEPVRELMRRLSEAGDRAGAIAAYERLSERLRTQLGIAPSAATREAAAQLRGSAAPAMSTGGVVALLFTDVAGSTALLERLGEDDAERLRRDLLRLMRDALSGHGGQEVKNLGDGLMAVFASIVDAVRCGISIQQSIARFGERSRRRVEVRVGINAGEPFRSEGDWFGTPVVVARRLCDGAEGGQILVSRLVRDLVGGRGGFRFRDAGELRLKGLSSPVPAAYVQWSPRPERMLSMPAPLIDPTAVELIGRSEVLRRLGAAWERARTGRATAALITGEPGIGKTRLAAELAGITRSEHGALVLFGRCDEEMLAPYQPFVEALDRYAEEVTADELRIQTGEQRPQLARLVPAIERRLGAGTTGAAGDPDAERFRLFAAVTRLLREISRPRPALLVLDDLHWADEPTLQLLSHAVRELADAPLLVVGTYRATEVGPPLRAALAALRRLRCLEEIELGGLDPAEVEQLIAARRGGDSADAAAIHERTDGNPLFVEEVLRAGPQEALPASLQDLIGRRLSRLDERAARTLAAGAVVGAEFDMDVVARALGRGDDELLEDIESAIAAHAVREVTRVPGRLAFAHGLVRETVYESLSAARRMRLHQRIGEVLEQLGGEPAVLAHHFAEAGDPRRALSHVIAAARSARALAAAQAAARHYDRAMELAERLGASAADDPEVRAVLIERAELRHELSQFAASEADAQAAVDAARTAGDRLAEMRALTQLGYARRDIDLDAALPYHEAALAIARELGDPGAEARTLNRLALLHVNRLALDRAFQAGERALALGRAAGEPALIAHGLDALKLAAQWLGDLDRLEELTDELLALLPEEQPWYRGFATYEKAFVAIGRRDWAVAGERLDAAAGSAARAGSRELANLVLEARCWMCRDQGRLEEAVGHGRAALQGITGIGSNQFFGWVSASLATALLANGDVEEAAAVLEEGASVARRVNAPGGMLRCAGQLAWARALAGDLDGAQVAAADAELVLDRASLPPGRTFLLGAHGILGAARARLAAGDSARARALAAPVLSAAQDSGWCEFAEAAHRLLYESGQKTS